MSIFFILMVTFVLFNFTTHKSNFDKNEDSRFTQLKHNQLNPSLNYKNNAYEIPLFYFEIKLIPEKNCITKAEKFSYQNIKKFFKITKRNKFHFWIRSYFNKQKKETVKIILNRFLISLTISLPSIFIASFLGIIFAVLLTKNNSRLEFFIEKSSFVNLTFPTFFFVLLVVHLHEKILMQNSLNHNLGNFQNESYFNYTLPILINTISYFSFIFLLTKSMIEIELHRPYITVARAKGLNEIQLKFRHILKNISLQLLTQISSLILISFSSSIVIESIFNLPGLGSYTLDSIKNLDISTVIDIVLFISILSSIIFFLIEVMALKLDPRINFNSIQKF